MEPWRVGRPTVADSHHLDEKPDPNPIIIVITIRLILNIYIYGPPSSQT